MLYEYDPATESYSGQFLRRTVTYILFGGVYGLPKDCVIMSVAPFVAGGADPLEPDSMDPAYIGEAVEKALARLKAHVALAEAQSQEAWTKLMEVKKERDALARTLNERQKPH